MTNVGRCLRKQQEVEEGWSWSIGFEECPWNDEAGAWTRSASALVPR